MWTTYLSVALGGAIGATARFAIGVAVLRVWRGEFPLAVLAINIVGSFLMGLFVVASQQRGLAAWNPLVMSGLLGGFTTFSAFSLEAVTLVERGAMGAAALYVGLSVGGALLALVAGLTVGRGMFA